MNETFNNRFERLLDAYAHAFQRWLPSPFSIAILLTFLAGAMALSFESPMGVLDAWTTGLWNPGLLRFGFQAMFMLVLGHVLALAPPVLAMLRRAVDWVILHPASAPAKVAALSMALGWLNWGLGLIGGAILVRGVLDRAKDRVHVGLLGASGYTGLLVWHGGLSGSAPLKVAESGHLASLVPEAPWVEMLPVAITLRETTLSSWSLAVTGTVMVAVTMLIWMLGWRLGKSSGWMTPATMAPAPPKPDSGNGGWADRLDQRPWLPWALGLSTLIGAVVWAKGAGPVTDLAFVTPDWINMMLLGLALVAHGEARGLLHALEQAIAGASGILIQFPLYFGIMGMVTGTGLGAWLAEGVVAAASDTFLPLALFVSSGVLNLFVPSGGGQWAVQGPLVLEACHALGVPLERGIMAMAFGDELTNMLQPFWALPLLGITGLSARDILPFTLLIMLVAGTTMTVAMLFWVG